MMEIIAYIILIPGLFFVVAGTLRAVFAHTIIGTLHFLTIADTVGLIFLVISAFFFGLLTIIEMLAFIVALMVTGPLVTHVIARAFINSGGREK
ncbi:Na+/H+ antiporter subunit [Mesotoga prima MesG1.Ag.4.2]|jgi:multicomponent Na+:H+ antiporter subunit G|uniref:Na+/H+ antiporter subunit n=1 Tax=Mesotoga prima MesG1.Ag.4.2 TaxID=660470 RepID=I2F7X0_9BACT|nr:MULTISPECIES: monovalent cation/H(+) antiporter subunit G [Mesotoga]AFK08023.1 Na+/H+ antiporter subunit [Mesotoga prima MesG1.Ag.4.2]RLL83441.1 sodium:proton antiporter [Mesotoga sp. H07pep.5.4]HQC14025.1 monovalent cation/H(+) antiporter subunit G [Mesotoga prima]